MRLFLASVVALILAPTPALSADSQQSAPVPLDISQTVVRMPLADGVTVPDAIQFLQSKAAELNMKMVGHQPVSKELKARGIDSGPFHIFQFCNPDDAHKMVQHNPLFAAYMPCRIALVEDREGQVWLMMLDLNILIESTPLPPDLKAMAERINRNLMAIMRAGAKASF